MDNPHQTSSRKHMRLPETNTVISGVVCKFLCFSKHYALKDNVE